MEISFIPNFLIRLFTQNEVKQINLNILLSSIIVIFAFSIININVLDSISHFCLFHKLTDIPCPACGITRSIYSIYDGNFVESYRLNPNGILILIAFSLQIPLRIIALANQKYFLTVENISKITNKILIVSLITSWIYIIITNK